MIILKLEKQGQVFPKLYKEETQASLPRQLLRLKDLL
jgi:hypothetical protein